MTDAPRYRFGSFVVSTRRRTLQRDGQEVALIPRYFDLLVLLLERRHDAVHRDEIFARVWSDVVVSDGALSQAIRTLRRTLGDDSREPLFIRTVARHGYRFVHPAVIEELDEPAVVEGAGPGPPVDTVPGVPAPSPAERAADVDRLVDHLVAPRNAASEEDRRDVAERLHALGTAEALARLEARGADPLARALLRDSRWDVPGAGEVPLVGRPGGLRAGLQLARLRWHHASRQVRARWTAAASGGLGAGACAGAVGGLLLAVLSPAVPASAVVVLAAIGAAAGALGGAGIGAGLEAAEALARSRRGLALVVCGGLGGSLVALLARWVVSWTLEALFGLSPNISAGPLEGAAIGAAAGLGYAWATPQPAGGGIAAPRRRARLRVALQVALCCGLAAIALGALGRQMVGGVVNETARAAHGSRLSLSPLGVITGEAAFGPLTGMLIGAAEGAVFGFGLALGLTRRPRP